MKQRIISAMAGLVVLAIVILFFNTIVLNFAVSIIIVIAIDELMNAAKCKDNKLFYYTTNCFGAAMPFLKIQIFQDKLPLILFAFSLVVFCIMLKYHTELSIINVGFVFCFTLAISLSATCIVYMRDLYGNSVGLFAIVLSLAGAWMSDTGAYFFGVFFGKHKLAPKISPKKTIEGAIGGVIVAVVSLILFSYIYSLILSYLGISATINYLILIIISPLISLVSIVGDLTASIIKRQFNIKDFGNIMPGHGGVLDRFDSVLMVIPLVYNLFLFCPPINIL